jgi:hypothetical protein
VLINIKQFNKEFTEDIETPIDAYLYQQHIMHNMLKDLK